MRWNQSQRPPSTDTDNHHHIEIEIEIDLMWKQTNKQTTTMTIKAMVYTMYERRMNINCNSIYIRWSSKRIHYYWQIVSCTIITFIRTLITSLIFQWWVIFSAAIILYSYFIMIIISDCLGKLLMMILSLLCWSSWT